MKKRISITNVQAPNYLFNRFLKHFRTALQQNSIGQMLTSKQVLTVLSHMKFVDQQPLPQDIELSKTITKMLANSPTSNSITRANFFKFLTIVCDIQDKKQSVQSSYFQDQISGLSLDVEEKEEPLILVKIGDFDECGRWVCNEVEKEQVRQIFKSINMKRISRGQEVKKKMQKKVQQETFKPKICLKSSEMANRKRKTGKEDKVENRLLQSRQNFRSKVADELNRSRQKQLTECTFKPKINSRSRSNKQNIRHNSQDHLRNLFDKGHLYQSKRQRLKQIQIKLNQSAQLEQCTFKPTLYRQPQSTKWVYVRNRQKEIDRLRQGRKQRQFINQVKDRGYPSGVGWCQYMNSSKVGKQIKQPILCIDLKILNQKNNINVYEGDNLLHLAEKISRENKVPQNSWWKVEQLIRKAIQECSDVLLDNNRIYSSTVKL